MPSEKFLLNQLAQNTFVTSVVSAVVPISRAHQSFISPQPLFSGSYTLHCIVVSVQAALLVEPGSSRSMACPHEKANDFCSCVHLAKSKLGTAGASEIAALLGFPDQDNRWCTPWGEDVTYLCVRNDIGGFGSKAWTLCGWILDEESMCALQEEFPDEWFLGVPCSLGFPSD